MGGGASVIGQNESATGSLASSETNDYSLQPTVIEREPQKIEISNQDTSVIALPRGGLLVNYSSGNIQFGIPPETIKDSLAWGLGVPTKFVILGEELFDRELGINIAEIEFPAYFNFFVFGKRVTLICTSNVEKRIRNIFQETLLGPAPENYCLAQDFASDLSGGMLSKQNPDTHWPDFVQEGLALDKNREVISVDALIHFETIDTFSLKALGHRRGARCRSRNGSTTAASTSDFLAREKGKVMLDEASNSYLQYCFKEKKYIVREQKRTIAQINSEFLKPKPIHTKRLITEPFEVPIFGITMLGNSHGFDPKGTTTGFIVWTNRRGIMIDPPPNSAEVLRDMSIPYRLIDGMILTHCHADHDAGAFQKILADSSIKIYTTQTIMDSFLRKYTAISGFDTFFVKGLFVFDSVKIGETKLIHGAYWDFFYSLHVIPTIGFEVQFAGEGIVYSGDTCTNFKLFDRMKKEKRIGTGRYNDLVNKSPLSRWRPVDILPDGTVTTPYKPYILHEAGVPPIHTPLEYLSKLAPYILDRLFVVHADSSVFDKPKPGFKLKTIPQWSTLIIPVDDHHADVSVFDMRIPAALSTVHFFKHFSDPSHLAELSAKAKVKEYEPGAIFAKKGDLWESAFVVLAGTLGEIFEITNKTALCYVGDFVGEPCMLDGAEERVIRNDHVVLDDKLFVLEFPRELFMKVLLASEHGKQTLKEIQNVASYINQPTWDLIQLNSVVFNNMNRFQKQIFQRLLSQEISRFTSHQVIFTGGEVQDHIYFVADGLVSVHNKHGEEIFLVGRGSMLSDVNALKDCHSSSISLVAHSDDVVVYKIPRVAILNFWNNFPGIKVQCIDKLYIK